MALRSFYKIPCSFRAVCPVCWRESRNPRIVGDYCITASFQFLAITFFRHIFPACALFPSFSTSVSRSQVSQWHPFTSTSGSGFLCRRCSTYNPSSKVLGRFWGGALRDDTKNGCVADYPWPSVDQNVNICARNCSVISQH